MDIRKLEFILQQLQQYSGVKKAVKGSTFVSCPFHSERTPSCRIFHTPTSRNPGYFKCYGCSAKGDWDSIAVKLGLRPFEHAKPIPLYARRLDTHPEERTGVEYQHASLPVGKRWRGISTKLLTEIGCSLITEYGSTFVYMPVNVLGEERGYIRARLKKEQDKPSYLNKPGKWAEDYGLFPFDYAVGKHPKVVVLVEGPRDALRLLSEGIPAMAILGTQSWTRKKSYNLELSGADHVILVADGDDAGKKAEELIVPTLKQLMSVSCFSLRSKDSPYWPWRKYESPSKQAKEAGVELWDPCNMPDHKLEELKQLINLKNNL